MSSKPTTQQMVATLTEMFAKHDRISDAAADKLMGSDRVWLLTNSLFSVAAENL